MFESWTWLWIILALVGLWTTYVITRSVHGFKNWRQVVSVFRVFRCVHVANNNLEIAAEQSADGDVTWIIKRYRKRMSTAATEARVVNHPALVVDPTANDEKIAVVLKVGFHNQAIAEIEMLQEVLDSASEISRKISVTMGQAGEGPEDFRNELKGVNPRSFIRDF